MLSYAVKRITRSWKLFAALALGMTLAATFFGGLNVAADTVGRQALDAQLVNTPVDMVLQDSPGPGGGTFVLNIPTSSFQTVVNGIKLIDGVVSAESLGTVYSNNGSLPSLRAIQDTSQLYSHFILTKGTETLQANETLINTDSSLASNYSIGSKITFGIGSYYNGSRQITPYNMTLKVVGFVSLDTNAQNTLGAGNYFRYYGGGTVTPVSQQSVFITSWEKTFTPFLNFLQNNSQQCSKGICMYFGSNYGSINIYLDRNRLISPFGIENSISQIQQIEARITTIGQQYGFSYLNDHIVSQLQEFSQQIFLLRLQFTVVSIPVFFLAWYVGRTVSQSSFNLRRKEIGLLLTRGFTRTQLFRHFLTEGLIISLLAAISGIVLAYGLTPAFLWALGGSAGGTILTTDTVVVTLLFTVILTFFSIFSPARQAAALDPAQSLKEYLFLEQTQPRRKRGAILAFSLGLYQLILLSIGINYQNIGNYFFGVNFFFAIVLFVAAALSLALTFIGPFLFLYGAAQLSTGWAERFHRKFASLSRRMVGDIAVLASRNVFRNPRRVAALVFIIALIVGYSIWVIGDLASQQDYNYRQAEVQVGSDIRISGIGSITNATLVANQIRNWQNITGATPEADFQAFTDLGNLQVKAIDPSTWRQGAYYEAGWFTGNLDGVFSTLSSNNHTIVLDRGVASYYNVHIENALTLYGSTAVSIISFFGPDYSQTASGPFRSFQSEGWSLIPIRLLPWNASQPSVSTTNIVLAKARTGIMLGQLAQSLQRNFPSLSITTAQLSSQGVSGAINTGSQNVLRLGTAFAGLAASIGVGTVAYTGYREREKEITMIAVRGLSYRQLAGLLVMEFLPLVVFSLILATTVGIIVVWGDAQGQNSLNQDYLSILAARRVIFPLWALSNILGIVTLLIAGIFLPAIFAAKKDLSKINRTVRFA